MGTHLEAVLLMSTNNIHFGEEKKKYQQVVIDKKKKKNAISRAMEETCNSISIKSSSYKLISKSIHFFFSLKHSQVA